MKSETGHERLKKEHWMPLHFSVSTLIVIILVFASYSSAGVVKGKVTSAKGDAIELNMGSDRGIRPGDSGRVYYTVTIEGKERSIYVAKFKISHVADRSSSGQIQEKTTEIRAGYLVEISIREGELEVRSEPSGAKIYVGGKEVGKSPLVLPHMKPGEYTIRLVQEGYETYEERVKVVEGERNRMLATLKKAAGGLSVTTEPPGATISLDGKPVGVSPYEGKDLAPRSYKIRVSKEGFEIWEKEETVEVGKRAEVFAQLKTMEGSLEIVSQPSGARVYMDGSEVGETPLTLASMRLGQYTIRVVMEGYAPYEEKVEVKGKDRRTVSALLKKEAGGLAVQTEPPGADIFIDGKSAGRTPFERKDLPPGTYKIRIVKEGYRIWEGTLAVIPGRRVEVPVELKAMVGGLEISSEPPGAKVYLNKKEMGQTPLVLPEIQLGTHLIRMVKEGYEPHEEEASVAEGERKRIRAFLKRIVGELSIRTEPPGATIYIDGKPYGTSPYNGKDLSPGTYQVRIVMEGYAPWEGTLAVIAGKRVEVPVELKAKLGQLEVQSEPAGARVYVDGIEMGQTPLSLSGLRIGQRKIRVMREGYEPYEEQVRVTEGKNRVSASLKRLKGDLSISTEPSRSDLFINGGYVGTSPYEGRDLAPGTYTVKTVKEGYETREMDVVVKAGEANRVRVDLKEKKKEIAASSPPAKPEPPKDRLASKPPGKMGEADLAKKSYAAPVWSVGDKWAYKGGTGKTWTDEVAEIKNDLYVLNAGETKDLKGYDRKNMNCPFLVERTGKRVKNASSLKRALDFPVSVGKKWKDTAYGTHRGKYGNYDVTYFNECRVEGVEKVTIPAGTFAAYKIYCKQQEMGVLQIEGRPGSGWVSYWYSPEVKTWVKREFEKSGHWPDAFQDADLVSYELK